jgi:Spy/CpxP family protein refolding chaperone
LRRQMKQNRQALAAAIRAGDDARIDQITKAEAPIIAQLAAIRAHAKEKIYATLTPEKKAKADQKGRFPGTESGSASQASWLRKKVVGRRP